MVGSKQKLNFKSELDFARLPPCGNSLIPYTLWVNHIAACYKRAKEPIFEVPKPDEAGQG